MEQALEYINTLLPLKDQDQQEVKEFLTQKVSEFLETKKVSSKKPKKSVAHKCVWMIKPKVGLPYACDANAVNEYEGEDQWYCGTEDSGHYNKMISKGVPKKASSKGKSGTSGASGKTLDSLIKKGNENITRIYQKKIVTREVPGTSWFRDPESNLLFEVRENEEGEEEKMVIGLFDDSEGDCVCAPLDHDSLALIKNLNLTVASGTKTVGKKAKVVEVDEEGEDEEVKPKSKAKKAKVVEDPEEEDLPPPRPKGKKTKVVEDEDDEEKPKTKAKSKKVIDDDEEEVEVKPKTKAKSKTKKVVENPEEDDDEVEVKPKTKSKKKAVVEDEEDDEEEEDEFKPKTKAKSKSKKVVEDDEDDEVKPKTKAKSKSKKVVEDDDEEVVDVSDPDDGLAVDPEEGDEESE